MKFIHVSLRGIRKAAAEVCGSFIPAKRAQLQPQDLGGWIQSSLPFRSAESNQANAFGKLFAKQVTNKGTGFIDLFRCNLGVVSRIDHDAKESARLRCPDRCKSLLQAMEKGI